MKKHPYQAFTVQQALAIDEGGTLAAFDAALRNAGVPLDDGAVINCGPAGILGSLVPPECQDAYLLIVRLHPRFEPELQALAAAPLETRSETSPKSEMVSRELVFLKTARCSVTLRLSNCEGLNFAFYPRGAVLCIWAGQTIAVRHADRDDNDDAAHYEGMTIFDLCDRFRPKDWHLDLIDEMKLAAVEAHQVDPLAVEVNSYWSNGLENAPTLRSSRD